MLALRGSQGASLSRRQAGESTLARRYTRRSCRRLGRPCQNSTLRGRTRKPPQCGGRGTCTAQEAGVGWVGVEGSGWLQHRTHTQPSHTEVLMGPLTHPPAHPPARCRLHTAAPAAPPSPPAPAARGAAECSAWKPAPQSGGPCITGWVGKRVGECKGCSGWHALHGN